MTKTVLKILDSLPYLDLSKYLKARRQEVVSKEGRYALTKKLRKCPYCGDAVGAREYRRHCRRLEPECPARTQAGAA